ncbi:BLOC-1-related complex subunit [Trichinella spiralis]|uniref:BLOC-1-related complex subunit n=1 Tax=Trichinella spiralis TaxID=6334 RepID=A0ABR3KP09_TRISP
MWLLFQAGDASLCTPNAGNVASLVRRLSSEFKSKSNAPSDHCRKISEFVCSCMLLVGKKPSLACFRL